MSHAHVTDTYLYWPSLGLIVMGRQGNMWIITSCPRPRLMQNSSLRDNHVNDQMNI